MNKKTEKAFQDWLKTAKRIEGFGDDFPSTIKEAMRRAFTAGAHWQRVR